MSGLDFLLKDRIGAEELRPALAAALGVPETEVCVLRRIQDLSDDVLVATELNEARGDFASQVSVYVRRDAGPDVGEDEIRELARLLSTEALVPGDSPNPYAMRLIGGDAEGRDVTLDPERLDSYEEYRLQR